MFSRYCCHWSKTAADETSEFSLLLIFSCNTNFVVALFILFGPKCFFPFSWNQNRHFKSSPRNILKCELSQRCPCFINVQEITYSSQFEDVHVLSPLFNKKAVKIHNGWNSCPWHAHTDATHTHKNHPNEPRSGLWCPCCGVLLLMDR